MDGNPSTDPRFAGENTVLFSGYARLPDSVASHSQYERVGVILVVDLDDGRIVAADTTLLTGTARAFFASLVEGLSVFTDLTVIVERVQRRYLGQSGSALLTALRRCLETVLGTHAERKGPA
ncbi:MAG TPA: DUF3870 domain-containing protein [Streptosporangiaceae bacterium]|jgi:hypothetical protein